MRNYTKEQEERDITLYGKNAAKRIKARVEKENEDLISARHKEIVARDRKDKRKRITKKVSLTVTPIISMYVASRHPDLTGKVKDKVFDKIDRIVETPSRIKRQKEIEMDLNEVISYNHLRHQHGDF